MSMTALGVSTAFMVCCCIAAEVARRLTKRRFSEEGGLLPILFNEAIASAELCACCFELIIGIKNFDESNLEL